MRSIQAYRILFFFVALFVTPSVNQGVQAASNDYSVTEVYSDPYGEQLGTVHFPMSCNEAAKRYAERGLALLHHMTYEGARAAFAFATEADPQCSMGYWGQAMSYIHPLWSDPPSAANFERGQTMVNKARAQGQKTDREQAYIAAAEAYYAQGRNLNEMANLTSFEEAWQRVYNQFPKDPEAASFYALSHMATADPTDKSYTKQKRASMIAKQVLTRISDHPGAHHYIIHANDYPSLANEAIEEAHGYGEIAPKVPHALHMPTHIFTRLGMWQESIIMNQRSAAAAKELRVGDKVSLHYLHALDYLAYAYLQRLEDRKAKDIQDTIKNLEGPYQAHVANAYTFAAVPARIALERQQWNEAAMLEPRTPNDYPWDQFPAMEAITHFARALGAARSGNGQVARQALDKLSALQHQASKTSVYWAKQIDIQQLSAQAWLMYQEGKQKEALSTMRTAAEMEASTEKHPVTPGEVLPAHEMLADMLLEIGRYQEAHTKYEAALARSPLRFNSLYGAGRTAELEGNNDMATFYYKKLIEVTADDAEQDRLQRARIFLSETKP